MKQWKSKRGYVRQGRRVKAHMQRYNKRKVKGYLKLGKEKPNAYMYINDGEKNIYLGHKIKNIDINNKKTMKTLTGMIGHENLHILLEKEIGKDASAGLDAITTPILRITTINGKDKLVSTSPSNLDIYSTKNQLYNSALKMYKKNTNLSPNEFIIYMDNLRKDIKKEIVKSNNNEAVEI